MRNWNLKSKPVRSQITETYSKAKTDLIKEYPLEGPLYRRRDPMSLGSYYTSHMLAMTAEDLHSKSSIAEELAYRDMCITELKVLCAEAYQAVGSLISDLDVMTDPKSLKLLDNLSSAERVHTDLLPFPSFEHDYGSKNG